MTRRWARTAATLLALTSVSAIGMAGCGFLSSRGKFWERFTIALAFGTFGSMIATLGMAAVYFAKIRFDLHRLVRCREPLADDEFVAMSPELKHVDPVVVHRVRQSAAKQFRSIGGDRFYPGDDLETDLHLSDVTFLGEWLLDVTTDLKIEEDELARGLESMPVRTYGDLVLLFDRSWRQSKAARSIDGARSHTVWDRTLDG
jgi:hypothetical protein